MTRTGRLRVTVCELGEHSERWHEPLRREARSTRTRCLLQLTNAFRVVVRVELASVAAFAGDVDVLAHAASVVLRRSLIRAVPHGVVLADRAGVPRLALTDRAEVERHEEVVREAERTAGGEDTASAAMLARAAHITIPAEQVGTCTDAATSPNEPADHIAIVRHCARGDVCLTEDAEGEREEEADGESFRERSSHSHGVARWGWWVCVCGVGGDSNQFHLDRATQTHAAR